jgi:serine/threonine protein kinase
MSLVHGTRLGPYEIAGMLGAGGMGEVYRARNATLNRDVALKGLPASLDHDVDAARRHPPVIHLGW